jgi:hypothetical protein
MTRKLGRILLALFESPENEVSGFSGATRMSRILFDNCSASSRSSTVRSFFRNKKLLYC